MKKSILVLYVLFACFGVYYLPYTYMYYVANKNADDYANDNNGGIDIKITKRNEYLQNVWDKNAPNVPGFDFSYNNIISKSLKLGADFNGGVSILLDVNIDNFIKEITNGDYIKQIDDILNDVKSLQEDYDLQEYIGVLITKIKDKGIDHNECFLNLNNKGQNLTYEDVKTYLCDIISRQMCAIVNIITKRLRQYGIHESYIYSLCGGKKIKIYLPDYINYDDVKDLLQYNGDLQFFLEYDTRDSEKIIKTLNEIIESTLCDKLKELPLVKNKQKLNNDMLYSKSIANDVEEFLNNEEIKRLLPENIKICKKTIMEKDDDEEKKEEEKKDGEKEKVNDNQDDKNVNDNKDDKTVNDNKITSEDSKNITEKVKFYFIALDNDGKGVMSGDYIESIDTRIDRQKDYIVDIGIKKDGIDVLKKIKNNGNKLILTMDDTVVFVKKISDEIDNKKISITGKKRNEAKIMCAVLNNVYKQLYINILATNNLGPQERDFTKKELLQAILFGILLIGLLMILLYKKSGFMVSISLLVAIFYMLVLLHIIPYNLTLTNIIGIGLILPLFISSIVTLHENIKCKFREENVGINFHNIKTIYKDTRVHIFEDHIIVFLICMVVFFCCEDINIRGLLTTMSVCVMVSFLISSYFTYFLFWIMFRLKRLQYMSFAWSFNKDIFKNVRIDFVKLRFLSCFCSLLLCSIGVYSIYKKWFICSADFCGGYEYIVEIKEDKPYDAKTLQRILCENLNMEGIIVKKCDVKNEYEITISDMCDNNSANNDNVANNLYIMIENILNKSLYSGNNNTSLVYNDNTQSSDISSNSQNMLSSNSDSSEVTITSKDSTNSDSIIKMVKCYKIENMITKKLMIRIMFILCMILAFLFLYVFLRFKTWQYAFTTIISYLHSCIGIFAIYGLMRCCGYTLVLDYNLITIIFIVVVYSIKNIINIIGSIHSGFSNFDNTEPQHYDININKFVNIELSRVFITIFSISMFVSAMYFMGCVSTVNFWFVFFSLLFIDLYSPFFITTAILKFLQ